MDMGDLDQTAVRLIPDKMEMRQQAHSLKNWVKFMIQYRGMSMDY